jgi:hypothetical protein
MYSEIIKNIHKPLTHYMRLYLFLHEYPHIKTKQINNYDMSKIEIVKKITVVTFTAFNMKGTMILEDVDDSKIQETIRRKTSNTAIVHTTIEYDVVNKKETIINEDTSLKNLEMPEKFMTDMYKKLAEDGSKNQKK